MFSSARARDELDFGFTAARSHLMFDPELDSFKSAIDLRAYATSLGYVLDRKESWCGSAVMRHADGDKVIIKRDADGHYVYFSVRDEKDHGSIIDFVARRKGLSLRTRADWAKVGAELRRWIGKHAIQAPYPPLPPTTKDRMRVDSTYAKMHDASRHAYLESERDIPVDILRSDRFLGRIRIDARGNAVFPHFDRQGLCGFEIKNRGFTGFAPGGTKGLWLSRKKSNNNCLVFCESAIDALSYAALFPDERSCYASIGGQISPVQRELIRAAIAGMPLNARIVAATDADAEGGKLADSIRQAVELTGRDDLVFVFHQPDGFKDWNDQLRKRPQVSVTSRRREPSVR